MQVEKQIFAAQQATQSGRLDEAARLWSDVLRTTPDHPQALLQLGQYRLYRGDPAGALDLLRRAAKADPKNPMVLLGIGSACRARGDTAGELAALDHAITVDPYCFPALLAKGSALDRTGKPRQAAKTFRDALAITPPDEYLPPEIKATVARAHVVVDQNAKALEALLADRLSAAGKALPQRQSERFEEAIGALLGTKKVYTQQASMLHYPRLPAIPFYERREFPWVGDVESATDAVREELRQLLEAQAREFQPYLSQPMGAQAEYAPHWNAYFLWKDGKKVEDHCGRCPKTVQLLESLPLAEVPGAAPTVFFSALDARSGIPPHTGATNTRLIVHLPLIVPENCWFRVGNQKRQWRLGEALIFDDTIEHEAWNESDKLRVLLIFDIWNPYLSDDERRLVGTLMETFQEYYRE